MPASLIAIPYTILEISTFLGQLPVDEKSQLNTSIASLRLEQPPRSGRFLIPDSGQDPDSQRYKIASK